MNRLRLFLVVLSLFGLAACGSDDGGADATATTTSADVSAGGRGGDTVALKDLKFNPATITIERGEEVRWVWQEKLPHNVIGKDFKSETKSEGDFRHTFDSVGTFAYECDLHAGMEGKVVVR